MPSVLDFTKKEWEGAIKHSGKIIPELKKSKIDSAMNGLFSFTVDGFPLMGEWANLKGFWTAEAVWVTHSAGVAKSIAGIKRQGTLSVSLRDQPSGDHASRKHGTHQWGLVCHTQKRT